MAMVKDLKDPESLNMPDDSAHNAYNNTTLKNADEVDEDGHYKRTGALYCRLRHTQGMYCVTTFSSFAALLANTGLANKQQANCITVLPIGTMKAVCNPRLRSSLRYYVSPCREKLSACIFLSAPASIRFAETKCVIAASLALRVLPICTASAACLD